MQTIGFRGIDFDVCHTCWGDTPWQKPTCPRRFFHRVQEEAIEQSLTAGFERQVLENADRPAVLPRKHDL
jgi:hypothetical protein